MDLKEHIKLENKNGGRLRVSVNTVCPREGPLRLTGLDSRGRRLKIVGDEEFIIRMILDGRATVPVAVELGLISAEEYASKANRADSGCSNGKPARETIGAQSGTGKRSADDLKALMDIEKQHGARLRLQKNTARPEQGPLRLTGRDSRGNPVKAIGDEAFLCKLLMMFPSLEQATA